MRLGQKAPDNFKNLISGVRTEYRFNEAGAKSPG